MINLSSGVVGGLLWLVSVGFFAACGQQVNPTLQPEASAKQAAALPDPGTSTSQESLRSSSELGSDGLSSAVPVKRIKVFQAPIEPLALQRGGTARVLLPLSDDPKVEEQIESIAFVSDSAALKGTSVQGRVLLIVVDGEAAEGRHESRIVVQLAGGSLFSQPVSISVLP